MIFSSRSPATSLLNFISSIHTTLGMVCTYMYMYMSVPPSIYVSVFYTEYGESDRIYGYAFWSRSKNGRQRMCLMCQPVASSSSHSESVASASDSEHESTSYASSSLGHQPPPRKKGMGQKSPSLVGAFDVVLKKY